MESLLQNRCPTLYEKKVEDGFDFPSDKSSVSFWIVRVGWVNLMLQSTCDGCWAQAWLAFQPVQFDLLESTSFCTSAFVSIIILGEKNQQYVSVSKKYTKNVLFLPETIFWPGSRIPAFFDIDKPYVILREANAG